MRHLKAFRSAAALAPAVLTLLFGAAPLRAQCTGCANPSFGPALAWFGPDDWTSALAVADFNRDGVLDVAAPSPGNHEVAIHLGDGLGGFPSVSYVGEKNGYYDFVATGDFNADGFSDLVQSGFGAFEVSVADGLGGFLRTAQGFTARRTVVTADFDGNGRVDLATAEAFYPGLGDGSFATPIPLPGGPYSWIFAVADYDGNGLPDFVGSFESNVSLLLAQTSGGFSLGGSYAASSSSALRDGVGADLDGNGAADLVVSVDDGFQNASLQILIGDGAGALTPGASLPAPSSFLSGSSMLAADFDGDGAVDILIAGSVRLYPGLGGGSFGDPVSYDVGAWSLALGDFNRDGLPDAAAAMKGFTVLLAKSSGGFAAPEPVPFSNFFEGEAASADLTGDGIPDLAATDLSSSVSVFPGLGDGSLGAPQTYALPSAASSIAVSDFKEDGAVDLAVGLGSQIAILAADGSGGFLPPVLFDATISISTTAAGLFDADAHQDLVAVGGGVDVFLGNGAGGFSTPSHISNVIGDSALVADFNGDTKADIVVLGGALDVFLGHGDGAFDAPVHTDIPGFANSLAAADFDGDGNLDVAIGGLFQVPVFLGNGAGGFAAPFFVDVTWEAGLLLVAAADFNGDGNADLAAVAKQESVLTVIPGDGIGGFGAASRWLTGSYPDRVITGDLDANGVPDVVTLGDTIVVLRNSNCEVRRLGTTTDTSTCASAAQPFPDQPALGVYDDGGNVVTCDSGVVSASIVPGTGTSGAALGGDTTVAAVAGVAAFSDLAIDLEGTGYQIAFSHPVAGVTRGRSVTVGDPPSAPAASNSGPFCQGQNLNLYASTVPGAVYRWTGPNGFFSTAQSPVIADATLAAAGLYSVIAIVDGCKSSAATTTVGSQLPGPGPAILGPPQACIGSRLLLRAADAAFRYQWYLNGEPIPDATAGVYTVEDAGFADEGEYSVSSSDVTGCTTAVSDPFSLFVAFCSAEAQALAVDPHGNGILEPGEMAIIGPTWKNLDTVTLPLSGTASGFSGPDGGSYVIADPSAEYGSLAPDASASCLTATGDCYAVMASFSGARPATHWDAFLEETPGADPAHPWILHVGESFTDVPAGYSYYAAIETVLHNAVTAGCTPTAYCPAAGVTRAQMAVLLLKAKYGAGYEPPPATGSVFADVPAGAFAAAWIERMENENITAGCGGGNYCPNQVVTRAQMAVFLLRSTHTGPSPCTGIFADVPCPDGFAVDYIEELYARGVTVGCNASPLLYCPSNPNTRGQMAVFLTRWFGLSIYTP